MTQPDVTVVVCTYNRAELLRGALASLLELRTAGWFRYEIVVVDNGSTDETSRVIEDAARDTTVPLRSVYEPRAGVSCARNAGVRSARGGWIAFFDDDQIAERDWLLELLGAARRTGARCVGGAVRLALEDEVVRELPPVCRALLGELVASARPRRFSRKASAGTGNLLVHRTVFEQVGLFDETLGEAGEDTDVMRRVRAAGIDGWFAPTAVVRHVVPRYRLGDEYFRWSSLRNGMHVARRDVSDWGRGVFPLVLAARVGQVILRFLPRWLLGRLLRSRRMCLEGRCLLWRAEGYFRLVLNWLGPLRLARSDFVSQMDFRAERELFAKG